MGFLLFMEIQILQCFICLDLKFWKLVHTSYSFEQNEQEYAFSFVYSILLFHCTLLTADIIKWQKCARMGLNGFHIK